MHIGKGLAAAFLASLSLLAPLKSANADTRAYIDGIGAARCSQITTDIQSNPTAVANSLLGWSYGYMTRRNMERAAAGQAQVDLSQGFNDKKMLTVILRFCDKEPDILIFQVVDSLYEVLLEHGSLTS